MRVQYVIAIAVAAALLAPASTSIQAQGTPAAVLKKSAPPLRGTAELGFVQTAKLEGNMIVTTFQVKNLSVSNAIVGLQISEFWYDKAGNPVTGDNYRHPRPLQPGEVITITLETPRNPAMNRNQYNFTHANGDIKATLQPKL